MKLRGLVAGPFCLLRVLPERRDEGAVARIGWTVMQETDGGDSIRFPSDHLHRPCAVSMARAIGHATGDKAEPS